MDVVLPKAAADIEATGSFCIVKIDNDTPAFAYRCFVCHYVFRIGDGSISEGVIGV